MGFREKLIGLKKQLLSILALGSGLKLCPRRWSSHPGVQWLRYHLELLAVLLTDKGGTASGFLESGWVIPSVPGTKAFTALITKLISYYLN